MFFSSGLYKQKVSLVWSAWILIIYTLLIYKLHPHIDIKYNMYPRYMIFVSVPVIYALYQICYYLSSYSNVCINFLADCGKKSITLLGLHRPLWLFVYPICLKLHLNMPLFIAVEMISALIVILPLHKILNKYIPILIGQKGK